MESLIPPELEDVGSGEEFLDRLGAYDGRMEGVRAGAVGEGMVVRYVGSIDVGGGKVRVGMERFAPGEAVAGLRGSDNVVSFWTERYGENPLGVQGAG